MFIKPQKQTGVTLIELIIAMVIIGVALAGIASAMTMMIRRSADPVVAQQEIAIANAYIGEISAKAFGWPGNGDPNCNTPYPVRADRTNICQYDNLNEAPKDQYGVSLGLTGYTVNVNITGGVGISDLLLPIANDGVRIDVTVTGPNQSTFTLTGYRTNYGS